MAFIVGRQRWTGETLIDVRGQHADADGKGMPEDGEPGEGGGRKDAVADPRGVAAAGRSRPWGGLSGWGRAVRDW